MAKCGRGRQRIAVHRRHNPYSLPFYGQNTKGYSGSPEKKKWEESTCSVCMECPHNAVLLLCSSHDKGCRPFMCDTSFHFSNCLDQYKRACSKDSPPSSAVVPPTGEEDDSPLVPPLSHELKGLSCPLCRGEVKGWTVVDSARAYLNRKRRSCMQENCAFLGTYKELRRHVRLQHPLAQPRKVDPILEHRWTVLEHERERDDVISTITSSIPGAMIFGDYVIEAPPPGFDPSEEAGFDQSEGIFDSNLINVVLFLSGLGQGGGGGRRQRVPERLFRDEEEYGGGEGAGGDNRVNFQHRLVRARRRGSLLGRERG